jgi:hypothetical protein
MSTDRELLELAAKAAGIEIVMWTPSHQIADIAPLPLVGEDASPWNPLTDDGDALRLAVKLNLSICRQNTRIGVSQYGGLQGYLGGWYSFVVEETDEAITRRAIVRAAAALGRSLP